MLGAPVLGLVTWPMVVFMLVPPLFGADALDHITFGWFVAGACVCSAGFALLVAPRRGRGGAAHVDWWRAFQLTVIASLVTITLVIAALLMMGALLSSGD